MRTWVLIGTCILLIPVASSRAEPAPNVQTTVPAYLRILRAEIIERGPFNHARMAERGVAFRVVTAGAAECSAARAGVTYTFLIDAWPWITTERRLDLAPELRAQAKVEISCDAANRTWRSSVPGRVTAARTAAGENTLELATTLVELPSVDFRWIALASEGDVFVRAPGPGRTAWWRIQERILR